MHVLLLYIWKERCVMVLSWWSCVFINFLGQSVCVLSYFHLSPWFCAIISDYFCVSSVSVPVLSWICFSTWCQWKMRSGFLPTGPAVSACKWHKMKRRGNMWETTDTDTMMDKYPKQKHSFALLWVRLASTSEIGYKLRLIQALISDDIWCATAFFVILCHVYHVHIQWIY